MPGDVQRAISDKLTAKFTPLHLEVINESRMHAVPPGSETHFKVIVVSDIFTDMTLLQRHRAVNAVLDLELKSGVHALSIVSKTPAQWTVSSAVLPSPSCLGGGVKK